MKKWILLVALVINTASFNSSHAQSSDIETLEKGIYLVVGSFQNKSNALKFKNKLVDEGKKAKISFSDKTSFYYVHIKSFESVDEAIPMVKPTRENTPFNDAWVLAYSPNSGMTAISTIPENETTSNEELTDGTEPEVENTDPAVVSPAILSSDIPKTDIKPKEVEITKYTPELFITDKKQYKVIFNTFNFVTLSKVTGSVNIIDPDRLKLIRSVRAHEVSYINNPHNQSNSLEFIAEIFGYKKAQHDLKLGEEMSDDTKAFLHVKGDTLVMDFPLKRYEKGDVAIMYNVFFYKDAAIMKPESQFELNSLLELLQEKSGYNIRISGHTNGNAGGKIIEIDSETPEYFSLSQATKEKNGSAKKLSLKRAEIIQKYLINNGIAAARMEVKGFGGKMPIYDKFDRLAARNVRVEIEILQ